MGNNNTIKLNKIGYEEYLKSIEKKEKELADLRIYKGSDAIFQGDNWHDNPTLYQAELKEKTLMFEISEMRRRLNNIEIVENSNDESLIDIGDVVNVEFIYSNNAKVEKLFKLVGATPNFGMNQDIQEISINSPLGVAIYHKKVGDNASYKVNERVFNIYIKEKVVLEAIEDNSKPLRKGK